MNQQHPSGYNQQADGAAKKPGYNSSASSSATKTSGKDYIEFEEIK